MISTSQKEHLTYTAIGQFLIIVGAIVVLFTYVSPGFSKISEDLKKANTTIGSFKSIESNGLTFEQVNAELHEAKGREELISIIKSASRDEVTKVIQKNSGENYISWLKQAINGSSEDRKKLVQIKQKINSILPTMSPMSANIDEENITLKQYIRYIEAKILKEFAFESNVVLGLQGIQYGGKLKDGTNAPKTIGYLDLSLDFNSTNADIQKFITYVNNSGNGELLTDTGTLKNEEAPGVMSNPLITIESISLTDFLNPLKPNAENSGRVTLRFYVRGSSQEDLVFLTENIKTRKENIKQKIASTLSQCKDNASLCGNLDILKDFQLKYQQFLTSTTTIEGTNSIQSIEKLSQQVNSLRAFEKELDEIAPSFGVSGSSKTTN